MAGPTLSPAEVGADDARRVLTVVNSARDAAELATAIEIPGENDIGVRLAARLLAQRDALGGFASLEQIAAVPLIGPRRFTQIVVALTSARPAQPATPAPLQAEIDALRGAVAQLGASLGVRALVRLWTLQPRVWLGQVVNVLARVTDATGQALPNARVALLALVGELQPHDANESAASLSLHTDELGLLQVRWRPRIGSPLTSAQRLALERAVITLPLASASPASALPQLDALITRYRSGGGEDLRVAIDALHRGFAADRAGASARSEALARWSETAVPLLAIVQDEPDALGAATLATATHSFVVRDWVAAFAERFEAVVAADRTLERELARAVERGNDAQAVLNDALVSVQSFAAIERGELGSAVRHRIAESQMNRFAQERAAALPEAIRGDVVAAIGTASTTIGKGGLTLLTAVEGARGRRPTGVDVVDLGALQERLGRLESSSVRQDQLTALRDSLTAEFTTRAELDRTRLDALDARVAQFDGTRLDRLDATVLRLEERSTQTERSVAGLTTSVGTLNTRVDRGISNIGTRLDGIDARLPPR